MPVRLDSQWFPDVCTIGPTPLVMTGVFKAWLAGHFLAPPGATQPVNLEGTDPTFQKMLWGPSQTTGIVIESVTRWLPELTEKRPGILIKRNGWRRLKLGVGDRMTTMGDNTGVGYYANAWQGSHTLFCVANKGAEAELLTGEVYREINEFAPAVRQELNFLRLEVQEVGELHQLEEARQNHVVPIVVGYGFVEGWQITGEAPFLRALSLSLLTP